MAKHTFIETLIKRVSGMLANGKDIDQIAYELKDEYLAGEVYLAGQAATLRLN